MKRRMNNLFRKDGKAFILAMDHSAQMPSPDLADPGHIITEAVAGGVDGFLTTFGIIKNHADAFGNTGIILRSDGGSPNLPYPRSPMDLLYTPEDAIRIGADAMLCMGYPGSSNNEQTLRYLAKLCAQAEKYNFPVGAEMLPFGFEKPKDKDGNPIDTRTVELMSFACRQGADMGADFIKAEFVGGPEFRKVIENCYVPVLVLGGSKAKTEKELFTSIREAIDAGSKGIIMGRNIVRHKNIANICEAICAIVHGNASVEEALAILED